MKFYAIFSIPAGGYLSSFTMDNHKREFLFAGHIKKFSSYAEAAAFVRQSVNGDPAPKNWTSAIGRHANPNRIEANPELCMSDFEIHQFGVVVRTPLK